MKLQQILKSLQKLHPKEIDLSLDRIKKLCKKLGNPQDNLQYISVVGTNGKYSTIQAIRAILKDANINCNIYTSPHIQKINERFIYNDEEISDENLVKLLTEVEDINAGEPITYFEILTAAYFYNARNFKNNINLLESGCLIAFAGKRVIQATVKEELSPDFQTAEFVEKHGFVDRVVHRKDLQKEISTILSILLKKNPEVNSENLNETSDNIKTLTKTAS